MSLALAVTTAFPPYSVGDQIGGAAQVAAALIANGSDVIGIADGGASAIGAPYTAGDPQFFWGVGAPSGGLGGANCTYVNVSNANLWVNNAGTWQNSGALLHGPAIATPLPTPSPLYEQTIAFASAMSVDASTGTVFAVTLTGNATLNFPANLKPGVVYSFRINQDATGGRTLTFASGWMFAGASRTLSTAASAVDLVFAVYDGTNLLAQLNKGLV